MVPLKNRILLIIAAIILPIGWSALGQTGPVVLAPDGAWCWFGNPRATFKDGILYFSYVRFGDGRAALNAYDPRTRAGSVVWTSSFTQRDDHDNAGLLELSDGRLLAIYAQHGNEKRFYYRLSTNANPVSAADWGPERIFSNTTAGVTYANPYQLTAEGGRVFNFMRNLNFNPTFVTSDSSITQWSAPQILIKTGTGSTRPYVQYCSDFSRRIDFIYTDGHPDSVNASLYHAYYRDGALFRTDGAFLKYLTNAPLLHDAPALERGSIIYQYSDAATNDANAHIPTGRAWCWDLLYHTNGAPVAVFSVQRDTVTGPNWYDGRLYYYYARWSGTNWQKRFIAHAGRALYSSALDYAGGITVDPSNPDVVYISSNAADPFNLADTMNVPLRAGDRYEIFRGVTHDGGLSFLWQSVTTNSTVDNLRPYVPRRNPYPCGVLWYAGTYTTYTQWEAAMLGVFTTNLVPVSVSPPKVSIVRPSTSPVLLINLSNQLRLEASVMNDGQAGPAGVSWGTVSGPTNAIFANAASADTSVRFGQNGVYVLRVTANNTILTNSASLTVLAGNMAPPTDSSLALWLKLDESGGALATDSSGSNNHGALYSTGTWRPVGGVRGGGLEFDGVSGFVDVPDATGLDNTSAFTVALWFRANTYPATGNGGGLVSKRNAIADNNAYTTWLHYDHRIQVDIDGSNNRFASTTSFQTGQWYHVALTFDGSLPASERARLWVNGALDCVAAESSAAVPNYNSSLKIGLTHSNATTFLNGTVDDVRLYRRALNEGEIGTLAAVRQTPNVVPGSASLATNRVPVVLNGSATGVGGAGSLTSWWSQVSGPGAASFANSNQPATSVTFTKPGPYTLRLSASDAIGEVFGDLALSASPNPSYYEDWCLAEFHGETNTAIIADNADPDGDGARNLLEFALGMTPTAADAQPSGPGKPGLPVGVILSMGETNYLVFIVRRPIGRQGILYQGEVSGDLSSWTNAVQVGPPADNGDGTETVVFRDTVPVRQADHRFIRLKITTAPSFSDSYHHLILAPHQVATASWAECLRPL